MADELRALSEELARDPESPAYVELAEALRRRGQQQEALRVASHGLSRHPQDADGQDCLGRIYSDLGEFAKAREAWERALEIAPEHVGALKGIGFLFFRRGDTDQAAEVLEHALVVNPDDGGARRALETVRALGPARGTGGLRPPGPPGAPPEGTSALPAPPTAAGERPAVFVGLEGASADILLLDERGLVLAGGLRGPNGEDASELAAAALAGVSGEAGRTAAHLGLGAWETMVAEAERANLVLAPVGEGALLMVRRDRSIPVGLALRFAERARSAALAWLKGQGA